MQLKEILTEFPKNNLLGGKHSDLLSSLTSIQGLLGIPITQTGTTANSAPDDCQKTTVPTSKGETTKLLIPKDKGPTTRSHSLKIYSDGTIIRKKFGNHWYEGEITTYNPTTKYYHIKYTDEDTEEMTHGEVN